MEDVLEIWEFTDHHPSGKDVGYQLEKRGQTLDIQSDDPEFSDRLSKYSGAQVLTFLKYLVDRAGKSCPRQIIETELWKGAEDGIVETYLTKLRKLLNDDARSNKRRGVRGGRVIESLEGGDLRFALEVKHTPAARIQKTTLLGPFSSVPSPVHFIERPEISEPLIEKLLSGSGLASTTAVEGMAGAGKTIISIALCHDPRVREAFPDGIFWLPIGREPKATFEERMQEHVKKVCLGLSQEFQGYSKESYQTVLKDRAALVVLDNVWTLEDIEPFVPPPGRSRLLFTTRDKTLAPRLHAKIQEVGELDGALARWFLESWSGREGNLPEPHASDILAECGGLALGISVIGASLRNKPDQYWAQVLADLKKAKLRNLGKKTAGYDYQTLYAAIAIGVDALPPEHKERYLRLAVLLDDMPAATPVLQALWTPDEDDVHSTSRLLADRSLARLDNDGLLLHDLQLKYIRGEHPDPEALALLHSAVLRSYHVVRNQPEQFVSQMTGRLLGQAIQPGIGKFLSELRSNSPGPRLRPLCPAIDQAGGPWQRILQGSWATVTSVAVTPDGKTAVSSHFDGKLMAWDLASLSPPRCLTDLQFTARVAVTPDGKVAVCGYGYSSINGVTRDTALIVWDPRGDREGFLEGPRLLKGLGGTLWVAGLRDDGESVVTGCGQNLIVWDLTGQLPPRCLEGPKEQVETVALTPDGGRAIGGFKDGTIVLWELESKAPRGRVIVNGQDGIRTLAVTADGRRAILAYWDGIVIVRDLEGQHPQYRLESHRDDIQAVAVTPDAKRAVLGCWDGTLVVWDLQDHERTMRSLRGYEAAIGAVAVTPDGERAISACGLGKLIVWDLDRHTAPREPDTHKSPIATLAFSSDGNSVVSGSDDDQSLTLITWDFEGRQKRRFTVPFDGDNLLVVAGIDGNSPPRFLEGPKSASGLVTMAPDGRHVVYCHGYLKAGKEFRGLGYRRSIDDSHYAFYAAAATPGGKRVVVGSNQGTLSFWDSEISQLPQHLGRHKGAVRAVGVTADGRRAVSGSNYGSNVTDHTLIVWDLDGTEPPRPIKDHRWVVTSISLTPDGRFAVVGSLNHEPVMVWDLEGKIRPRTLEGHEDAVCCVAVSPDGKRAVSGSVDRTLILWDLVRGKRLVEFICEAKVTCCAFAHGYVAAGDSQGRVYLFAVEE